MKWKISAAFPFSKLYSANKLTCTRFLFLPLMFSSRAECEGRKIKGPSWRVLSSRPFPWGLHTSKDMPARLRDFARNSFAEIPKPIQSKQIDYSRNFGSTSRCGYCILNVWALSKSPWSSAGRANKFFNHTRVETRRPREQLSRLSRRLPWRTTVPSSTMESA